MSGITPKNTLTNENGIQGIEESYAKQSDLESNSAQLEGIEGSINLSTDIIEGMRPKIGGLTEFNDDVWLDSSSVRYFKNDISEYQKKTIKVRGTTGGSVDFYPCAFIVDADGLILGRYGDQDGIGIIYGYDFEVDGQTNKPELEITVPVNAKFLYVSGQQFTLYYAEPQVDAYDFTHNGTLIERTLYYDNGLLFDDAEYKQDGLVVSVTEQNRISISGANTSGGDVEINVGTALLNDNTTYYCRGFRTNSGNTFSNDVVLRIYHDATYRDIPMHWQYSFDVISGGEYDVAVVIKIADELNLSSFFRLTEVELGSGYDGEYFPHSITYKELNVVKGNVDVNRLYDKKASWNGDSITAGSAYTGGYPKIIAERNKCL